MSSHELSGFTGRAKKEDKKAGRDKTTKLSEAGRSKLPQTVATTAQPVRERFLKKS
jgi:hypothetical protein